MAGKTIDIFADLRKVRRRLKSGRMSSGIFQIDVKAPEFGKFFFDDVESARIYSTAILNKIKTNWRKGKAPDGTSLPSLDRDSLERRGYRFQQAQRNGEPSRRARISESSKLRPSTQRRRMRKNWDRRFKAARLGDFTQGIIENTRKRIFGYESGMLIEGLAMVLNTSGNGTNWAIFAPKARGHADKKGTSAMERVFKRVPIWNKKANEQPDIQDALELTIRSTIRGKSGRLMREAAMAMQRLQSLRRSAEDFGDK
jgi:hypothetical protein